MKLDDTFIEKIEKIYNTVKKMKGGKNADYIPALANVDPALYAISVCTVDGHMHHIGDTTTKFAIESVSKVFSLALALDKRGQKKVRDQVGTKHSNRSFNSIHAVEHFKDHETNSFSNAGAMATTCLSSTGYGIQKKKENFEKKIVDYMSRFAGKNLYVNQAIYKSEMSLSAHNMALAYLMKSYERFEGDVQTCVDVYTKQCSVMVTSKDLATMAATLANEGVNPKTGERAMQKKNVPFLLEQIARHGLYGESGEFHRKIGTDKYMHVKSGVSGTLLIVIPGVMGIGIVSPPLNKHGNSVKGIQTAIRLAKEIHG